MSINAILKKKDGTQVFPATTAEQVTYASTTVKETLDSLTDDIGDLSDAIENLDVDTTELDNLKTNFNLSRVLMLRKTICGDSAHFLQGGTYVSSTGHFVLGFCPIDENVTSTSILVELDTDFSTVIKTVTSADFGHCNDLTYNPTTNKIYISSTGQASGSTYERKVLVVNPTTLEIESGISFANLVTAISYDATNNIYYTVESTTNGREVFVYDSSFNLVDSLGNAYIIDSTHQVGQCSIVYNGKFIYVTNSNYINHSVWFNTFGDDSKIWQIDNFAYYEPETILEYSGSLYLLSIKSADYIYVDRIGTNRTIYNRTEEFFLKGTLLITSANLDNVTDTGKYYTTSNTANTITGVPYTLSVPFSVDVFHIGFNEIGQVLTTSNRMRFIRTYANSTWSEWASLRAGRKYSGKTVSASNFYTSGFVTTSGKSIRFSIPMEIETTVNTVSISSGSVRLLQGGNIILNTADITTTFDAVNVEKNEIGLSIELLFSSAPANIVNDDAIGIQLYSVYFLFSN